MKSSDHENLVLAGDIGGTKTNLGLFFHNKENLQIQVEKSYPSREYSSLEDVVHSFLNEHATDISAACFGIAGPVKKGSTKATNLPWLVTEVGLKERFGWKHVRLVNDLVATALSIKILEKSEIAELYSGNQDSEGTIGIVAPGTGLGMALLAHVDGKRLPLSSEGGHVDFGPKNLHEIELLKYLFKKMSHVSVERLASGPGISIIYEWLKGLRDYTEPIWLQQRFDHKDSSEVISEAAINDGEPLCVETMDMFVSIFGSVTGNLALTGMTTGGIYLAGGICPKILPKLREGGFINAFLSKGRFEEFMSGIPIRVITNDKAALLGAACCASDLLDHSE
jgi:glucokinase